MDYLKLSTKDCSSLLIVQKVMYAINADQCCQLLKKYKKYQVNQHNKYIKKKTVCTGCGSNNCSLVAIPYVMKYLINELGAMNIKLKFKLKA